MTACAVTVAAAGCSAGTDAVAPAPGPGPSPRVADMLPRGQLDALAGRIAVVPSPRARGGRLVRARYCGAGRNGFARLVVPVAWAVGDRVRYGVDLRLPADLDASTQGEIALLRWDAFDRYGTGSHVGGVVLGDDDGRAQLVAGTYDRAQPLTEPFDLPRGRWFRLVVAQTLATDGRARNDVFVDGRRVARSSSPNSARRRVDRVRFGLVAVNAGRQRRALQLLFARPSAQPSRGAGARRPAGRVAGRCPR